MEKLLKALFVKEKDQTPPYTHNLLRLTDTLTIAAELDEEKNRFLETLNSYYIESRYTEEMSELSEMLHRENAQSIFSTTQELFTWLRDQI